MARVRQTRSSLQANGHWGPSGVAELLITPGSSRGDSLRVELGYSNHEGGPTWYLHLRPASGGAVRQAAAAPTPGLPALELRLLVKGPDTVLYLHEAAHDGQRAHVTAFRRVPGRPEKANFTPPLQRFVNAHTLAGAHTATDSTGTVYTVRFSPEGAVTGMPGHRRYWVNFDFEGPFQEYDYVVFDESQPQKEVLAFTTHGDTVRLYRVIDDTTVYKRRLGKLRLSLVRSTK